MRLFPRGAPTTVHAQNADPAPITTTAPFSTTATTSGAADHHFYLPLIQDGTDQIKTTSGIHMGNRGIGTDWPDEVFTLLSGTTAGAWPAAVVVQSAQLYNFTFETTPPCRVEAAQVRTPNLYNYLTEASRQGTKIVIRITPSPGNFRDYASPDKDNHLLIADTVPAGAVDGQDYCDENDNHNRDRFRDILDVAQEMVAMTRLNRQQGWQIDSVYFEPANEPNNEWYTYTYDPDIQRMLQAGATWQAMDDYFSNLYDTAKALTTTLQLLTPSMGQKNYAEPIIFKSCDPFHIDGVAYQGGYDFMPKTYRSARFEGYNWHNYWNYGYETRDDYLSVSDCSRNQKYKPSSHHLIQYFPQWLRQQFVNAQKPTFITEADLNSHCQDGENEVTSKVTDWEQTKASLASFIENTFLTSYVVVWLLVQEDDGLIGYCADGNYEIYWHEAYWEIGGYSGWNRWFTEWWPHAE